MPARSARRRRFHVVAYDYGIKRNILRILADCGCRVTVVPAQTAPRKRWRSNPTACSSPTVPAIRSPATTPSPPSASSSSTGIPVFGICLGHQMLGLASGAKTMKMKFGHHGANHPVRTWTPGGCSSPARTTVSRWMRRRCPPTCARPTARCSTARCRAWSCTDREAFSFQGHPEASPGPHDVKPLFERFNAPDAAAPAEPADAARRMHLRASARRR